MPLILQLLPWVNTARLTHPPPNISDLTQLHEQQVLCETRGCPKFWKRCQIFHWKLDEKFTVTGTNSGRFHTSVTRAASGLLNFRILITFFFFPPCHFLVVIVLFHHSFPSYSLFWSTTREISHDVETWASSTSYWRIPPHKPYPSKARQQTSFRSNSSNFPVAGFTHKWVPPGVCLNALFLSVSLIQPQLPYLQ